MAAYPQLIRYAVFDGLPSFGSNGALTLPSVTIEHRTKEMRQAGHDELADLVETLDRGVREACEAAAVPRIFKWRCIIIALTSQEAHYWHNQIRRALGGVYSHDPFLGAVEFVAVVTAVYPDQAPRDIRLEKWDQAVFVQGWSESKCADLTMEYLMRCGLNPEGDYACVG